MADTRPLRERWNEYRSPDFVPRSLSDEIRAALLTSGEYRPGPEIARSTVHTVTLSLRRLGYQIVASGDGTVWVCTNPSHDPTPRQWGGSFSAAPPSTDVVATTNGTPAPTKRARRATATIAGMLPGISETLVVVAVGFDRDGTPFLDAVGSDGRRYSCAIVSTDLPS